MSDPIQDILNIDRGLHEPSRLAILTALGLCGHVDFMDLRRRIGMDKGNMSLHLSKLETHGLIGIEKLFRGKKPVTVLRLTKKGKTAVKGYWRSLEKIRRAVETSASSRRHSRAIAKIEEA
jgi:DNA-binding transcriptional ArsR family regulator